MMTCVLDIAIWRQMNLASSSAGLRSWLASDAQSPTGAFYAWVDAVSGDVAFEYPEITGYALTHFAGLPTPSARESQAGFRAGSWLVNRIKAGDLSARDRWEGGAPYIFDLAMIATGLHRFGSRFDHPEFVMAARQVVQPIGAAAIEGKLCSVPDGWPSTDRCEWSTDGFAHLIKATQALLLTCAGDARTATVVADLAAGIQSSDGRFVTHPNDDRTMLHPHFYAVEGLWMFGTATGHDGAIARAYRATEWAWRHQLASGGFPRYVPNGPSDFGASCAVEERVAVPEQTDVTAQAVRAALLLGYRAPGLSRGVARLVELSIRAPSSPALPYQPNADTIHRNTWASLFGHQALQLAAGVRIHWMDLV
jgi:hypothetical protein